MEQNQLQKIENALTPAGVKQQVEMIHSLMKECMREGEHYGVIPGTTKPTLLKPGAQKLTLMFQFAPAYEVQSKDLSGGHFRYESKCKLFSATGKLVAEGYGVCTSLESKFRYRDAKRKCPTCGGETLIKGKEEYGGGWICHLKKGGCGTKFVEKDVEILSQKIGKVENKDIEDCRNTVAKMACKRAYLEATTTGTAAGDIFNVDLEDLNPEMINQTHPAPQPQETVLAEQHPEIEKQRGLLRGVVSEKIFLQLLHADQEKVKNKEYSNHQHRINTYRKWIREATEKSNNVNIDSSLEEDTVDDN